MKTSRIIYLQFIIGNLFVLLNLQPCLYAQDMVVSNREPKTGEVHYFPGQNESSEVNPPGFVWLPEDQSVSYILQCSSKEDFSVLEYQAEDITLNVHCPSKLFRPGDWYWRYAYKTETGDQSSWSLIRKFTIPDTAVHFPQPTLTNLINAIPSQHTKLLLRPETKQNKYLYLSNNFQTEWSDFIDRLEKDLLNSVKTDEPPLYPSGSSTKTRNQADVDVWRSNRRMVIPELERAANFAFAYALTGEDKYSQKARDIIMPMMNWDPHGSTGWKMNDEIAMPMLNLVSRVYTWAYPVFTEEERQMIVDTMSKRAQDAYDHLIKTQHTVKPYGSHNNRSWHFLGEASIAFIDDIPEAKIWLKYAMDVFYTVYPAWNDSDGGWHEGIPYWNSYLSRVTWWLDIMETFGIFVHEHPFFQKAGDFAVYVQPPGQEFAGFGDMADTHSWEKNCELMKYLASKTNNQYWEYYARVNDTEDQKKLLDYSDFLRIRAGKPPAKILTSMPPSKVFEGTGIASFHSHLGIQELDTHFLFKSSPFGTQSHGFNAQNSFVLWREGLPVLHWSGHRDWHGSDHHQKWMWETKSDNSITVNGRGQIKHNPEAKGRIVNQFLGEDVSYVAGDASQAYGDLLTKYVRHAVFIKPDMIFLVDELEAPEPSTYEFHLHASEEFETKSQYSIIAKNQQSGAKIVFANPADLTIEQSSTLTPPPLNWNKQQWSLTAKSATPELQQTFVTFLKTFSGEELSLVRPSWFDIPEVDTYGFIVNHDKTLFLVVNQSKERIMLRDTETDAHMLILYSNSVTESMLTFAVDVSHLSIAGKTVLESDVRTNFQVPKETLLDIYRQYSDPSKSNQN